MKRSSLQNDLFSTLIQDIKTYSGKDPLLPWLRGIKKMKDSLPPHTLNEKLPRFLQKCAQTFESDRRYRNDLRYLRVWLQLMDFVDDPKALLRTMEVNHIGMTTSLFYQAYALYYEKVKKFEEAEKMYHLGVQNLAEPVDELQKSYEQFLHRIERHKKKKIQHREGKAGKRPLSDRSISAKRNQNKSNSEYMGTVETVTDDKYLETKKILKESSYDVKPLIESNYIGMSTNHSVGKSGSISTFKQPVVARTESEESKILGSDDTVVVKFVDNAIVGISEAEDACHNGLVDPTINMKEAMNAINSMFREPIEAGPIGRRSHRTQRPGGHDSGIGFEAFVDENLQHKTRSSDEKEEKSLQLKQNGRAESVQIHQEPFQIYVDDEESSDNGGKSDEKDEKDDAEKHEVRGLEDGSVSSGSAPNAFVFPNPRDLPSESSPDGVTESSHRPKFREDTAVYRFVGSTILDEPEVENVCHHGLVDPTINLKEAMEDINNMFGKPIDFKRVKRSRKQDKAPVSKQGFGGFSILPDDDLIDEQNPPPVNSSGKSRGCDLFEPTVFTKEAIDDINKMFAMPLDF